MSLPFFEAPPRPVEAGDRIVLNDRFNRKYDGLVGTVMEIDPADYERHEDGFWYQDGRDEYLVELDNDPAPSGGSLWLLRTEFDLQEEK